MCIACEDAFVACLQIEQRIAQTRDFMQLRSILLGMFMVFWFGLLLQRLVLAVEMYHHSCYHQKESTMIVLYVGSLMDWNSIVGV